MTPTPNAPIPPKMAQKGERCAKEKGCTNCDHALHMQPSPCHPLAITMWGWDAPGPQEVAGLQQGEAREQEARQQHREGHPAERLCRRLVQNVHPPQEEP